MNTNGKAFHPEQAQAFDAETRKMVNERKTIDRLLKTVLITKQKLYRLRKNGGVQAPAE